MRPFKQLLLAVLLWGGLFNTLGLQAQYVLYSEPEKDDNRRLSFEIIGKVDGNLLIYKTNRSRSWISVLGDNMQSLGNEELRYLPAVERTIQVDFFTYLDYAWMIYQYQRKNVVYCMAAKLDGSGKRMGALIELDTTHLTFSADNKLYSVSTSEDRRRIVVFKINSRNRALYRMTSLLFNEKLELIHKGEVRIPMQEHTDQLGDWELDNEGNLVVARFGRNYNDNINNASLLFMGKGTDALVEQPLSLEKSWLDNIQIQIDNMNKRYLVSSFYMKEKRGRIDGYYFMIWDRPSARPTLESLVEFSVELREEARGNASVSSSFNDYFIRKIVTKKDGGFILGSEAYYTTSRANSWNRWDYMYGSPNMGYNNNYYYSPYYNRYFWSVGPRTQQAVRFHADNIIVQSFNAQGVLEWSRVITKTQYDDETDDLLSFQLVKTGGELHILYNQQERRDKLINDVTVSPMGEITRNPALKNLDRGHDFMPALGKQVSSRQVVIPTVYRGYICFAKLDYN